MSFRPYDAGLGTKTYRRNLPHWQQEGTTYFVTFRLADSLPAQALEELEAERQHWLTTRSIPSFETLASEPEELRWEYARTFNARWHSFLDAGHGSCVLRLPQHRDIVVSTLLHFRSERMELDLAVIMPNRVHLLITPLGGWKLEDLLHSIKRFSARAINKNLNRKGSLWMDENFDHIVRSEAQLEHYKEYIRENPVKAGLKHGEWWVGPDEMPGPA